MYIYILLLLLSDLGNIMVIIEAVLLIETYIYIYIYIYTIILTFILSMVYIYINI